MIKLSKKQIKIRHKNLSFLEKLLIFYFIFIGTILALACPHLNGIQIPMFIILTGILSYPCIKQLIQDIIHEKKLDK